MKNNYDKNLGNFPPNNSMFNMFSDGLNKLKLKPTSQDPINSKFQLSATQNDDVQTSLADLEKLLAQLKSTSPGGLTKEENTQSNVNVRNNININVNNNFNMKSGLSSPINKHNQSTSFNNVRVNKSVSPVEDSHLDNILEQHPKLKLLQSVNKELFNKSENSVSKDVIDQAEIPKREPNIKLDPQLSSNLSYSSDYNNLKEKEKQMNLPNFGNSKVNNSFVPSKPPLPINENKHNHNNLTGTKNNFDKINLSAIDKKNTTTYLESNNNLNPNISIQSKPSAITTPKNVYNKPKANSVKPKVSLNTQMINNDVPINNISSIQSFHRHVPSNSNFSSSEKIQPDDTIISNSLDPNIFPLSPQSNYSKMNESRLYLQNLNNVTTEKREKEIESENKKELSSITMNDVSIKLNDYLYKNNSLDIVTYKKPTTPSNRKDGKLNKSINLDNSLDLNMKSDLYKKVEDEQKLNETNRSERSGRPSIKKLVNDQEKIITKSIPYSDSPSSSTSSIKGISRSPSSSTSKSPKANKSKFENSKDKENEFNNHNSSISPNREQKDISASSKLENVYGKQIVKNNNAINKSNISDSKNINSPFVSPTARSKLHESRLVKKMTELENSRLSNLNITNKNPINMIENSKLSELNNTSNIPLPAIVNMNDNKKIKESSFVEIKIDVNTSMDDNDKSDTLKKNNDPNPKHITINHKEKEKDIFFYNDKSKNGIENLLNQSQNEQILKRSKILNDTSFNDSILLGNLKTEPQNKIDPSLTSSYRKMLAKELIKKDDTLNKSAENIDISLNEKSHSLDMSMDRKSNQSLNKSRSIEDLLFDRVTEKLRRSMSPDKNPKNEQILNNNDLNTSVNKSLNNFKLDPDIGTNQNQNLNTSLKKNESFNKNSVDDKQNLNNSNVINSQNRKSLIRMNNIGIQENNLNQENSKRSRKSIVKADSQNDINKSSSKIFNKSYDEGVENKNLNKSEIKVIKNDPNNNEMNAPPDFNDLSEINLDIKEPNQTIHSLQLDYEMIRFKNKDQNSVIKENDKNKNLNNQSNLNLNKSNLDKNNQSDEFVHIRVDPNPKIFVSSIRDKTNLASGINKNVVKNPEVFSSTFDTFFKQQNQKEVDKRPQMKEKKPSIIESVMNLNEPDFSKIINNNKPDPQKNLLENTKINTVIETKPIDNNFKKESDISNSKLRKGGNKNSIFNTFNKNGNNTSDEAAVSNSDDSVVEVQIMNPNTNRKSIMESSKILNETHVKEDTINNNNLNLSQNIRDINHPPKSPVNKKNPIRKSVYYMNETQENMAKSALEKSIEEIKYIDSTPKKDQEASRLIADLSKDAATVRNSVVIDPKKNEFIKSDLKRIDTKKDEINKKDTIKNDTQLTVTHSSISEQSFKETNNKSPHPRRSQIKRETVVKPYQNLVSENDTSEANKKENSVTSETKGLMRRKAKNDSNRSNRNNSINGSDKQLQSKRKSIIDEKFTFITNFDKEEEFYHEKIRDYEAIFQTVDRSIVNRRRNAILSNSFYKDSIMKEVSVLDKYKKNPKSFSENFEVALSEFEAMKDFNSIFKNVIGDDNYHKSEVIEQLKNSLMINSRIGTLIKTNFFAKAYDFENSGMIEILDRFSNEVSFMRQIKCDGDSFFRAFMFSLFENYILTQNIHEIKKIVLDIFNMNADEDTTFSKMKGIDFKIVIIVFNLIMENMEKNNIQKAYEILINAYYLEDMSFDMVLIGYMRITLWMIAKATGLDKLQETTKKASKEKNKKKTNDTLTDKMTENSSTNKNEIDKLNFDVILMYQNEPNKLVLSLSTLVFNVNMDLYIFDGSLNQGKNHNLAYTKTRIAASNVNELPVISLCYYMSNYYKVYNKQFSEKHNFYLMKFIGNDNEAKVQIGGNFDCEKCGMNKNKIYLIKYSMMACFDCLKAYLDKLIEKRAEAFFSEDYNNREFYCRVIEIKDDVFLDEHDIYKIYRTNLGNLLLNILKESCIVCKKKMKENSNLCKLECGCLICKGCLKELVDKATNGQFIQNEFEKKCI